AIKGFANDDIEQSCFGVGDHLLVAGPLIARATDRAICVGPKTLPLLLLDIASADLDLIIDRSLSLIFGGIAGVDDGTHRITLSRLSPASGAGPASSRTALPALR